jgi:peptidoglycan/LPS O-acetylase OafA/YrhL
MTLHYRSEIDGLRTLAIVPVVLCHAHLAGMDGGFLGVDVFFVISGYLIARIIFAGMHTGTFTFAGFYERRIRRILPALLTVIFTSLCVAPLIAMPDHLMNLSYSSIAAIFSGANFYFWSVNGYFAPAVEFMPLLHTWSLGVEEQFYMLFPVLLVAYTRLKLPLRPLMLFGTSALFAASLWVSYAMPSAAFYLLPARAWQLMLGVVLAAGVVPQITHATLREALALLGLAMVATSMVLFSQQDILPGWVALMPCLGAALIIHCTGRGELAQRILSLRPMVFIGLISYSLYLWHWPVLAFFRMYFANMHLTLAQSLVAIALSVGLSILSWRYIERPFRNKTMVTGKRLTITLAVSLAAVGALCSLFILTHGLPQRLDPTVTTLLSASKDYDKLSGVCSHFETHGRSAECRFGVQNKPVSYVILGDSHAQALRGAFDHIAPFKDKAGSLWALCACPFLPGVDTVPKKDLAQCTAMKALVMKELAASPEITHVIITGRWIPAITGIWPEVGGTHRTFLRDALTTELSSTQTEAAFARAIARTAKEITAMGKTVIFVGAVASPDVDVPQILSLGAYNNTSKILTIDNDKNIAQNRSADAIFRNVAASHPHVYYVPIQDIFFTDNGALTRDGVPLFYDYSHVTLSAAKTILGPEIEHRLKQAMAHPEHSYTPLHP